MEYAFCSIFLYAEKKKARDCALAACEYFALYVFYEITTMPATGQEEDTSMKTTAQPTHPTYSLFHMTLHLFLSHTTPINIRYFTTIILAPRHPPCPRTSNGLLRSAHQRWRPDTSLV